MMIIIILLLIILNYSDSYILTLNNNIIKQSNTRRYLFFKPDYINKEDEVVNIYSDYLLKDKSKGAIHKVINVPELQAIKTSISETKRSQQSKEFCIRSGGYPNNDIKYTMYKYIAASAIHNNNLQKINANEKSKMKESRCIELKLTRETMMTFGIL